MTRGKTVLVPGGGIGGSVAAARLRKLLPREHRVVLVEREPASLTAELQASGTSGAALVRGGVPSDAIAAAFDRGQVHTLLDCNDHASS